MSLKVSVSGIRGVVGTALDAESLVRWASAYGQWLPAGPVVVARDSRPSGQMVAAAVQAGLMSTGHDVIDAGLATTPTTEMLVQESDAVGGVIVTASHNPVEWNALKLLQHDGLFLSATEIDAVVKLESASSREHKVALETGKLSYRDDGDALHLSRILDIVDVEAIRPRICESFSMRWRARVAASSLNSWTCSACSTRTSIAVARAIFRATPNRAPITCRNSPRK